MQAEDKSESEEALIPEPTPQPENPVTNDDIPESEDSSEDYDEIFNGLYVEPASTIEINDKNHILSSFFKSKRTEKNPVFILPPPLFDPDRKDDDVMEYEQEMLLWRKHLYEFKRIDERINMMTEKMMQTQARFFLQFILVPYIRGNANNMKRAPDAMLREYVQLNKPIRNLLMLENFYNNPRVRMFQSLVKNYLPKDDEELKDPLMINWWRERLVEVDPLLGEVIIEENNGDIWLSESLTEITRFLRGRVI